MIFIEDKVSVNLWILILYRNNKKIKICIYYMIEVNSK